MTTRIIEIEKTVTESWIVPRVPSFIIPAEGGRKRSVADFSDDELCRFAADWLLGLRAKAEEVTVERTKRNAS